MDPFKGLKERLPWVWHDGEIKLWKEAQTEPAASGICYATSPFDGLRLYRGAKAEPFLAYEHIQRNIDGCAIYEYPNPLPYTKEDIAAGMLACAKLNADFMEIDDVYVRTTAWLGAEDISVAAWEGKPHFSITFHPIASHPVDQRLMLSKYRRATPAVYHTNTKSSPIFAGSQLATREAQNAGYTVAMMLEQSGNVADCDIANLILIYEVDGKIEFRTPEPKDVLDGFTIQVMERLCDQLHIPRKRCTVQLDDLKDAVAAMVCGTAKEVCIVTEIGAYANEHDPKRPLPPFETIKFPGHEVTKLLQEQYNTTVRAPVDEQYKKIGWKRGDDGPFLGPVTQEVWDEAEQLYEDHKHRMDEAKVEFQRLKDEADA